MAYQAVFKRYELKYLLSVEQKHIILEAMRRHTEPDEYGRTVIRNLYYDTDNYRLIRRSLEKPEYKEKLRVRSYSLATEESTVFVELKKKYHGVVYKRRISLPEREASAWLGRCVSAPKVTQISREIDYFLNFYGEIKPRAFISYEREAYRELYGDLRVTFDSDILFRQSDLSLKEDIYGEPILDGGLVLMELKCSGGLPLWMVRALSENRVYKTAFSKYGAAYEKLILPKRSFNTTKETKEIITYGRNI